MAYEKYAQQKGKSKGENMENPEVVQRAIIAQDDYLAVWLEQFLFDRRAQS
jgi:hypothetical protein